METNISYKKLSHAELSDIKYQDQLIKFLFTSLEQYSDPEKDIRACLDYILTPEKGGHVFIAQDDQMTLKGVVFLAKTHMKDFVPDYLLVYIATDKSERGKGIGKQLMALVTSTLNKPIALHVEHDNPAKRLYERIGFTSKYAEMRWYP